MNQSLLQSLQYNDEYKRALTLTEDQCNLIVHLAKIKNITYNPLKKPGETVLKYLDRMGYSVEDYRRLMQQAMATPVRKYTFRPQAKVAILIGNENYEYLNLLATPVMDCDNLSCSLESLGFKVFLLTNLTITELIEKITKIVNVIPEESYCFVYYAGHGCEVLSVRCALGVRCPAAGVGPAHVVTERRVRGLLARARPALTVLVLDMCRTPLDRSSNPELYDQILTVDDDSPESQCEEGVVIVVYTTSSAKTSYEMVQIEHSGSLATDQTYSLRSGDVVLPAGSLYARALAALVATPRPIARVLDAVHAEVEKSVKDQRPIKVECGTAVRSLHDPVADENSPLLQRLRNFKLH